MKSKPYAKGVLITSIVLSALITISSVLQFGDFYYALKSGSGTPEIIVNRLEVDQATGNAMVAGLREANSNIAGKLAVSPLTLVALAPLILYLFVCFYDGRTSMDGLGKTAASIIFLQLMIMVGGYVFVTTQHG